MTNNWAVASPGITGMVSGHIKLDQGNAEVTVPDEFAARYTNFRYLLTPFGQDLPDLHVSRGIEGSTFKISSTSGSSNQRVDWMVIGTLKKDGEAFGGAPVGAVLPFAGPTPPLGWLLCDGSEKSREEFKRLFSVIGTTFGEGDGSTFNLPDLRGHTVIGAGKFPDATQHNIGERVGEESHQLSVDELPKHNHKGKTLLKNQAPNNEGGDHTHVMSGNASDKKTRGTPVFVAEGRNTGSGFILQPARIAYGTREVYPVQTKTHDHTFEVKIETKVSGDHAHHFETEDDRAAEELSHNNMQPSVVLNYIIKF